MSIVSSKVKIYSNSALTNLVATVNGTTSLTQTLTVTGLNSSTQYWAVAEATDDNNLTGYSVAQMFTTSAATYIWSGSGVSYSSSYDTLDVDIAVSCSGTAHFTSCGIEFSTNSHFTGTLISGYNTTSPASDFVNEVTGFAENTTYYYRYVATSSEYGTQYYTPTNNIITTHYAEPTLSISADQITDTSFRLAVSYTGNYAQTNYTARYAPHNGTWVDVQLQQMTGTQYITISGLTPNTLYDLETTCDYYDGEITATGTVTTLAARPSVVISSVSDITPSSANVNITIS